MSRLFISTLPPQIATTHVGVEIGYAFGGQDQTFLGVILVRVSGYLVALVFGVLTLGA